MAYEIVATATFEDEYDRIVRYHLEVLQTPQGARNLVDAMDAMADRLSGNPKMMAISRKERLLGLELREYPVRNYVVVYRIEGDAVYLEHMFHQTQDFENLVG